MPPRKTPLTDARRRACFVRAVIASGVKQSSVEAARALSAARAADIHRPINQLIVRPSDARPLD